MELKQSLYKLYSATLINPIPFEEFCETFHAKWKQAYGIGIVSPIDQLAQIDYHHKPTEEYGFGFGNGIKLAIAILLGKGDIELIKPERKPEHPNLENMTKAELIETCELNNLEFTLKDTKAELIKIIKEH